MSPLVTERAIAQAAFWMARLWSEEATTEDEQACLQWRQAAAAHEAAWQRLLTAQSGFDALPPGSAAGLVRPGNARRRQLLLLALGAGTGLGGLGAQGVWTPAPGNLVTATGERQSVHLVDGGQLHLNTETRLDLQQTSQECRIRLYAGELLLEGRLPSVQVLTNAGVVQARAGLRLGVRQTGTQTTWVLYEGQGTLTTSHGGLQALLEGRALQADEKGGLFAQRADPDALAWLQGKLVATDMPVTRFGAELARYRRGRLQVDPALSTLSVSGVFSIDDTDQALAQLQRILPVRVRYLGPYWVRVLPA